MMLRILWLILLVTYTQVLFAQITGKVLAKDNNLPLAGASIIADNESLITNQQGQFQLSKPTRAIIISYMGYKTDTVRVIVDKSNYQVYLKPDIKMIEPIIVKANLNRYAIEQMPTSIGYIGDLQNENQNVINFVGNLNQIPGVFSQTGTNNTNRITIRGIGSRTPYGTNRIKAYYNDIPLTAGDGSTEIEDISASSIGSIEILKGTKSALYGSGLGGVIILNKPVLKNGLHAHAQAGIASFNTFKTIAGLQYSKNGFYISGDYSKVGSKGWRENSKYKRDNFVLNLGYVKAKSQLDITILGIRTDAHIPSSLDYDTFMNSPSSAAQNWLEVKGFEKYDKFILGLKYKYYISKTIQNSTNVFFLYSDGYESRPFNILDDASNKWGLRNITSLALSQFKIQLGFEGLFEKYSWSIFETYNGVQGPLQSKFSENRTPLSIFLNAQYELNNNTLLEAGLSINTLSYILTDESNSNQDLSGKFRYKTILSPFLGINFPIGEKLNIYSSLSHGFSAPSVEETLLPEGNINPDLAPETGINLELGIRYRSLNNRLFMDACIYNIWVNNLLVTRRESEEVFYGDNAGKTQHSGFEFSSKVQMISENRKFPISINVNYNLIRAVFTDFVDDGQDYTNHTLPGIPHQNIWTSLDVSSTFGASMSIQYQFVGNQYLNDANSEIYGAYQLLHLKMAYTLNVKSFTMDFTTGVRNIFNEHYAAMVLVNAPSFGGSNPRYYYPGMPRNYFLSLGFSF